MIDPDLATFFLTIFFFTIAQYFEKRIIEKQIEIELMEKKEKLKNTRKGSQNLINKKEINEEEVVCQLKKERK